MMQRRTFLLGSAALVACRPWMHPTARPETASEHERATLAAMAVTFLPGAADARAVDVIADPSFGVNPYISEVVSDLDDWCRVAHGGSAFVDLDDATREVALEQRMGLRAGWIESSYKAVYEGILALTKLAFFGGILTQAGTDYVGFPGASTSYAGASAAGAWGADGDADIAIDGDGKVSHVHLTAFGSGKVKITAPGGATYETTADANDVELPLTGGVAAGTWKIVGHVSSWSLRVRTDLDEAAA